MSLGSLFVVSAPSGAGKTSLVRALVRSLPDVHVSVSHTTRERRPGEREGRDYFFVDAATFQAMVAAEQFLEHAQVFGCHYGTAEAAVIEQLACGRDVVLEIDWQGAAQVTRRMPECVSVFILPPSRSALEARLRARAQDSPQSIARRLQAAVDEMRHYAEFDYLVVNDDFDEALAALRSIAQGRRLRLVPQAQRHAALLSTLLV